MAESGLGRVQLLFSERMHLYFLLRQGDFNLLYIGYRQLRLLWVIVRVPCFGEINDWLILPCVNTDEIIPVEVLIYEPVSLCFSKVADFCALFNPLVTVS